MLRAYNFVRFGFQIANLSAAGSWLPLGPHFWYTYRWVTNVLAIGWHADESLLHLVSPTDYRSLAIALVVQAHVDFRAAMVFRFAWYICKMVIDMSRPRSTQRPPLNLKQVSVSTDNIHSRMSVHHMG